MKVTLLFAQADQPVVFEACHKKHVEPHNQLEISDRGVAGNRYGIVANP
jgi:hypothetical protein